MLFNSIQFVIFLPIVFLLYWYVFDRFIKESRHQLWLQNVFVVLASYVFYGWWDWRFLVLIAFTSFCSWGSGILIGNAKTKRIAKLWTTLNIVVNLGILAIFKYYDFFVLEFANLFHISTEGLLLKLILPVGISFYTFQSLSYSIDVYRNKIAPTKDIVAFFAFISFFPQLVAGPIERATNLLPQFLKKREFEYSMARDGMRQILWGLFKKIVVADNCASYVDQVYSCYQTQSGSVLLLTAILFSFQIYCDFSGYSDIAIGTAKLFGIKLMSNFRMPYFSRDIAEFWRRWHISLNTWFRDYVYIPLGGSRVNKIKVIRNTFVIFLLSGLWHGANWTYILWGMYHALLFMPLILSGKNRKYTNPISEGRSLPTLKETGQMLLTFVFVVFGWILFRSPGMPTFFNYLRGMLHVETLSASYKFFTLPELWPTNIFIILMLAVEWVHRDRQHGLDFVGKRPAVLRVTIYVVLSLCIEFYFLKSLGTPSSFIYFQF